MKSTHVLAACFVLFLTNSFALAQEEKAEAKKAAVEAPAKAEKPAAKVEAIADKSKTDVKDLSGWWTGTWLSHMNGHTGPLNGYFTKLDDDNYCVHFNGMFWEIFPFEYNVVLTVTKREKDAVTMSGSQSLGLLLGSFSYSAKVTDTDFSASFRSALDWGEFSMTRWKPCEEEEAAAENDAGE